MKSYNLRQCQACSQNKELSAYQRKASQQWTRPSPTGGRETRGQQPELDGKGQTQLQRWHPLPNCNQAHSCLASLLDPGQLTSARKVTTRDQLPRGDTQHTWVIVPTVYPGNRAAGNGEVVRHTVPLRECVLAKHVVTWAAWTLERHKVQAQMSLCLCGVPEKLNLGGLVLGSARNPGPALDRSLAEKPGA